MDFSGIQLSLIQPLMYAVSLRGEGSRQNKLTHSTHVAQEKDSESLGPLEVVSFRSAL